MTDEYLKTENGMNIAYDRRGTGPVVILIGGAGQFRAVDPATAELTDRLGEHGWTVIHYDRPGRGDSGGDPPFTLAGEVAAVRALIAAHGGQATLYGSSSGAAIALAVAAADPGVRGLLLWEAPLGEENGTDGADYLAELRPVIAGGDPEAILAHFMADMPPEWFRAMRDGAHWPLFARMAPTVQADAEALAWTQSTPRRDLWRSVTRPVYVLLGRDAPEFFQAAADSLVANLAQARRVEVPGSGHTWPAGEMADALDRLLRSATSTGVPLSSSREDRGVTMP
ncbi:MAG TPA: alpha/beta hydrolase [Actinoplanes sp.]|nr:alpha/beta hydrolase [Actinoplanes sp.]